MAEPLGRAETLALLADHGVRLKKSLGQNFVVDPNTVRRIVEIAGVGSGSRVLEIGAGAGTLTRALVDAGAHVVAYEVDESLLPVLAATVGDRAEIRCADAAAVDFADELDGTGWAMVANLPYNVGTPIVLDVLRHVPAIERVVVMLQREAVERLAAGPGSKVYGLPSVVTALHATVSIAMRVGRNVFVPEPEVESAVAVLTRTPASDDSERAIEIASAAFSQRRKMVRSSLRGILEESEIVAASVDPTARAEDLAVDDYLRLAAA